MEKKLDKKIVGDEHIQWDLEVGALGIVYRIAVADNLYSEPEEVETNRQS